MTSSHWMGVGFLLAAMSAGLLDCGRVPSAAAISTAGDVPTVQELQQRLEVLELRASVRDDAINFLLDAYESQQPREVVDRRGRGRL